MNNKHKDHNGHKIAAGFFGYRESVNLELVSKKDNPRQKITSQQKGSGKEIAQIFFGKKSDGK